MPINNLSIISTTYTTFGLGWTDFLSGEINNVLLTGIRGGPLVSGTVVPTGIGLLSGGFWTGSGLVPAQFYVYQLSGQVSGALSNSVTGQTTINNFQFDSGRYLVTGLICTGINFPVYSGTFGPVLGTGAAVYINEI